MKKEIIFELGSPYRDSMRITAFHFGDYDSSDAQKSCAIVGATRGNEAQQIYFCARLVALLNELESAGCINPGMKITVIPTVNNYSVNTNRRFWSLDSTDINRMFPGYDLGETTQQIAYHVFEHVKNYTYGIQFASYFMPGQFMPHIRIMQTGYEDLESAAYFGLPYVYLRKVRPFDTGTLNYNWQIFGTKAFSFYSGKVGEIDENITETTIRSVVRFLTSVGICKGIVKPNEAVRVITQEDMMPVSVNFGGLLLPVKKVGDTVTAGELLGCVVDPYDATVRQRLYAPARGWVFYVDKNPFVYEGSAVYRVLGSAHHPHPHV